MCFMLLRPITHAIIFTPKCTLNSFVSYTRCRMSASTSEFGHMTFSRSQIFSELIASARPLSSNNHHPPPPDFHMPFFEGSRNVNIHGGEFHDIGGNANEFDYSTHTHYVNSHNTTQSTTTSSFNDSSTHEEGKSPLFY